MDKYYNQTIALAALCQSSLLVHQAANQGAMHPDRANPLIHSLFDMNPRDTASIYGDLSKLKPGLELLLEALDSGPGNVLASPEILRYAFSILHLESQLDNNSTLMNSIGHGLEHIATSFPEAETRTEPDCILKIADLYQNTVATLKKRIQVRGNYEYLSQDLLAARIRVMLMAGIRAAVLFRQLGGKRWQLIFNRKHIKQNATTILGQIG